MTLHPVTARVTARIVDRSRELRANYLAKIEAARVIGSARGKLGCGNLAHGFAASAADKPLLRSVHGANIGVVTAYNDMLSAHEPLKHYPELIRMAALISVPVAGRITRLLSRRVVMIFLSQNRALRR